MERNKDIREAYMTSNNLDSISRCNINIYTQVPIKEKVKSMSKDKDKGKQSDINSGSRLRNIKGLLNSFEYGIEQYNEFQKDMKEIEQTKKRAERELQIYYQYKNTPNLTNNEDGIVSNYSFIFQKEKSLRKKL